MTSMGKVIPSGVRLSPLIAIGILWIHTLVFRLPGRGGAGIVIVYHPGNSGFAGRVIQVLSETLAQEGHRVTVYSAHPSLELDLSDVTALGLASPLYAGAIRPPLEKFIAHKNATDVPKEVKSFGKALAGKL